MSKTKEAPTIGGLVEQRLMRDKFEDLAILLALAVIARPKAVAIPSGLLRGACTERSRTCSQ